MSKSDICLACYGSGTKTEVQHNRCRRCMGAGCLAHSNGRVKDGCHTGYLTAIVRIACPDCAGHGVARAA